MELVIITVLSALLPIMSILSFIVGYNLNAPTQKRVFKPKEKGREQTEAEKMIERIDNARI